MEANSMMIDEKQYPILTIDLLNGLATKIRRRKTTSTDCELIDHYLTSLGANGLLQRMLTKCGVLTFGDIKEALVEDPDRIDFTPFEITMNLLACIRGLKSHVVRGEKIR